VGGQTGVERGGVDRFQDDPRKTQGAGETDPRDASLRHAGVHRPADQRGKSTLPGLAERQRREVRANLVGVAGARRKIQTPTTKPQKSSQFQAPSVSPSKIEAEAVSHCAIWSSEFGVYLLFGTWILELPLGRFGLDNRANSLFLLADHIP